MAHPNDKQQPRNILRGLPCPRTPARSLWSRHWPCLPSAAAARVVLGFVASFWLRYRFAKTPLLVRFPIVRALAPVASGCGGMRVLGCVLARATPSLLLRRKGKTRACRLAPSGCLHSRFVLRALAFVPRSLGAAYGRAAPAAPLRFAVGDALNAALRPAPCVLRSRSVCPQLACHSRAR